MKYPAIFPHSGIISIDFQVLLLFSKHFYLLLGNTAYLGQCKYHHVHTHFELSFVTRIIPCTTISLGIVNANKPSSKIETQNAVDTCAGGTKSRRRPAVKIKEAVIDGMDVR